MLIGNQYADNKMYRGIKHYDSMPLTSGDLHEYSDSLFMKNAYLMNNLLGYGTLNIPQLSISDKGIGLADPSVVMIDGDISLIKNDEDVPLVSKDYIRDLGYSVGVIGIIGWYQAITAGSTMRNYGGVNNSEIENNLMNNKLKLQVSSRYQLRWFPIVISKNGFLSDEISLEINDRDIHGNILATKSLIASKEKKNNVFILDKSSSMIYADSDLYLIPLIEYSYDLESDEISASPINQLRAGAPFIVSEEEPIGLIADGTEWYNPITREFKKYVSASGGFVSSASKMAFLQYQSVHTIEEEIDIPQNIVIPVDINELSENDILQVNYEGIILVVNDHFTVNYEDHTITLLDFTTKVNDHIYFTVTKIVEANDITNVTETFVEHMATTSSDTVEGHVKLTDTISTSDKKKGVAATPKLVNDAIEEVIDQISTVQSTLEKAMNDTVEDSKLISDESSDKSYKLGVDNGLLYIEEV